MEELDPTEELSLDTEDFVPLQPDSPMLWFSGIVDLSLPLPSSTTSLPLLIPRRARLTLRTCVTSLDGSSQVVHSPPPIIVGNYQQAERWGEICALDVRERGGGEILEEVGRVRRERERKDLERAIEKSRAEGRAGGIGSGMPVGGGGGLRPTLLRNMRNGLPDGGGFTSAKIDGDGGGEGEEDSGEMVQDGDEGGHRGLDGLISTLTGMGLENRDKGGGDGDRAGVS